MTDSPIDWHAWSTEQPPLTFADEVMRAVRREGSRLPDSAQPPTPRRVRPLTATLVAAAVGTASLALLAAASVLDLGFRVASAPDLRASSSSAPPPLLGGAAAGSTREPSRATPGATASASASRTVRDRARRERVREKLRAAFVPGVERDPHTGLMLPSGAGTREGGSNLTAAYLQQRIREDFYPLAISCYEAALVQEPKLRGKVVIDFMIVGDVSVGGIVDQAKINASTDIQNPELRECMLQSMLSMVFEAPESGGWVTVTYPFELAPD